VGYPGSADQVAGYVGDATDTCFVDVDDEDQSAYANYEANKDDLVVIDRLGRIRRHWSTLDHNLTTDEARADLDAFVRVLLAE